MYKSCQKSDTTTILGAFRIFEIGGQNQSVTDQSVKDQDIYVESSLGPQTESPWFLIPSKILLCFFIIYYFSWMSPQQNIFILSRISKYGF